MTDEHSLQSSHKDVINPDKFRNTIAECVYNKAKKKGLAADHDIEDWLEAEQEINNQCFYWSQEQW